MSPGSRTTARLLGGRCDVVGRELGALAEEILLGLLVEQPLPLGGGQIQPVLVDDHLRELQPPLPRLHRDVVVDALPELVLERLVRDRGQLLAQLRALDHSRHASVLRRKLWHLSPMVEKAKAKGRGKKPSGTPRKRRGVKLRPTELGATDLALATLPAELEELAAAVRGDGG